MTEQIHLDQSAQTHTGAAEHADIADTPPTPDDEHMPPAESPPITQEVAQELRAAQIEWLERRGLKDTPRLVMTKRELEMLRSLGPGDGGNVTSRIIDETKKNYGIPPDAHYISVDVVPDSADQPRVTERLAVQEDHFGTVVDEDWLTSHGVDPDGIPRISVNERELGLFGIVGINDGNSSPRIAYARSLCPDLNDPQDDQYAPRYALIDMPDDPSLPLLVALDEANFGRVINPDGDNVYLSLNPDPDNPANPTYVKVDISHAITDSYYDLRTLAASLAETRTGNPLSGKFWFRAGGITFVDRDGIEHVQNDAYVWENGRGLASAVELTLAFPSQYNSVCAVVGDRRDPGNGKPGMAQIENPTAALSIEGAQLQYLQEVYEDLYHEPNFVLSDQQRQERNRIFDKYLANLIDEAIKNKDKPKEGESSLAGEESGPKHRALEP